MKTLEQLKQNSVLVVGLGVTGLSVCQYLHAAGVKFDVVDDRKTPPRIEQLRALSGDIVIHSRFDESLFCRFEVLIVSPGVALSTPAIAVAISRGSLAIGDIELFAMVVNAPVIAVTGSNGKSSVVAWLFSILNQTSIKTVLCGNIGKPVLDSLDPDAQMYVVELSSFQLETTFSLAPLSACVLNVAQDHMDRYDNLEVYARVKRRIYRAARCVVVNSLDDLTQPQASELSPGACSLQFGTAESRADYRVAMSDGENWLVTPWGKILRSKELELPGQHNLFNALAVLALLHPLVASEQLPQTKLKQGLKSFTGLKHRTQLVATHNSVRWFNDSKGTNVDSAIKAIEAMGVPVILIAGGLGKGADFSVMKCAVEQHVKALVLMGQDAPLIAKSLRDIVKPVYAKSMFEAVTIAARLATPGDAVLLSPACASFDMFDNFEHRGDIFIQEVMKVAA